MTNGQAIVLLTVITTAAAVVGLILTVRKNTRDQAREDARQRAEDLGVEFARGARSRDDEIALLKAQLSDTRSDLADTKLENRDLRLENLRLQGKDR